MHSSRFLRIDDDDDYSGNHPSLLETHSDDENEQVLAHFEIGDIDSSDGSEEDDVVLQPPDRQNDILTDQIYAAEVELHDLEATIVSPCDLPEDHVLRVDLGDGTTLVAQIPHGGVVLGQRFTAMYRVHGLPPATKQPDVCENDAEFGWRPPTDDWNADLMGCCEFGPCHPSYIGACFCNCILLPQIMNRMSLNWRGRRSNPRSRSSLARDTFTVVFLVFAAFYMVLVVTDFLSIKALQRIQKQAEDEAGQLLFRVSFARALCFVAFSAFVLTLLARTRRAIREHYRIPGSVWNDFCVSCWCHVCVLSQMARQSADYKRQPARWCTDNGLADEVVYDEFNAVEPEEMEERTMVVV